MMTHEHEINVEAGGGPENDDSLPDATAIAVYDDPEESFLPPLDDDLVD